MFRYSFALISQAIFDSALILVSVLLVLFLPLPEFGSGWDSRNFTFPPVGFVLFSRFISLEIPLRALIGWRRRSLGTGSRGVLEYILTGIILWVICQSAFWSVLAGQLMFVPMGTIYVAAYHAAVIIGTILFPIWLTRVFKNHFSETKKQESKHS